MKHAFCCEEAAFSELKFTEFYQQEKDDLVLCL